MKLKLFEIVTDCDKINIDDYIKVLNGKDYIRDWAYICHDKDDTRPHYHFAVRLKDTCDTKHISQWFGIAENFISKVKGRWADMLKYLIHQNASDKFQYSIDDVSSNFDWVTAKDKESLKDFRKDEILDAIENGVIKEFNYFDFLTTREYVKYSSAIDKAFKFRIDKLTGVKRAMECIFITGDSGTGKTTYAKYLAENKGFSVYMSSGSNDILDSYKGQDCIILDDLRPSCLGLSDLLKMLDNHTASSVKSRYKNKVLECKLIIITTVLPIDTFFNNVFSEEKETIVQLKRRCKTHLTITKENISACVWDDFKREYSSARLIVNPVSAIYESVSLTESDVDNFLSDMLGFDDSDIISVDNDFTEVSIQQIFIK